jgi:hypothetical protein
MDFPSSNLSPPSTSNNQENNGVNEATHVAIEKVLNQLHHQPA